MKSLTFKVPKFLNIRNTPHALLDAGHIDLSGDLRHLSDRCLEDIGLPRRTDRANPRPFWLP